MKTMSGRLHELVNHYFIYIFKFTTNIFKLSSNMLCWLPFFLYIWQQHVDTTWGTCSAYSFGENEIVHGKIRCFFKRRSNLLNAFFKIEYQLKVIDVSLNVEKRTHLEKSSFIYSNYVVSVHNSHFRLRLHLIYSREHAWRILVKLKYLP